MNFKKIILHIVILLGMISCDEKRVFDQYQSVGSAWDSKNIIRFNLPKTDAAKGHNLFVNIRNNDSYPFNNLFLIVTLEEPDGVIKKDTLEYLMAAPDGTLLGNGISSVKENKLIYKENVNFNKKGLYKIRVQQAVRQASKTSGVKHLDGITEVGFRIETL